MSQGGPIPEPPARHRVIKPDKHSADLHRADKFLSSVLGETGPDDIELNGHRDYFTGVPKPTRLRTPKDD